MNVKKQSLSAFSFISTLPLALLCSCVTQSALPFVLFTLLCPTPSLTPHNALPFSLLVVRPVLPSALCSVRHGLCLFLRALCPALSSALPSPFPALSCPALPCPARPGPAGPALPCPSLACPHLAYPALTCHVLP